MQRARNAAADAAKTPEESQARLFMYEKLVMAAQLEAQWHLRVGAPQERILSAKHIWDQVRLAAMAWAEAHCQNFGAGVMDAFTARMNTAISASKRLARQSRRRPEYQQQRRLEIRQHQLDTARANEVAAAMLNVERAQQMLAELRERPRPVARLEEEEAPEPEEADRDDDEEGEALEGDVGLGDDPRDLTFGPHN